MLNREKYIVVYITQPHFKNKTFQVEINMHFPPQESVFPLPSCSKHNHLFSKCRSRHVWFPSTVHLKFKTQIPASVPCLAEIRLFTHLIQAVSVSFTLADEIIQYKSCEEHSRSGYDSLCESPTVQSWTRINIPPVPVSV